MAGSSNANLVVLGLLAVILACCLVAIHMHPELLESVKNWFAQVVKVPHL
jgi:hypothetical protein